MRVVNELSRTTGTKPAEQFESLAFSLIVRNKKLFNLVNQVRVQIDQKANVRVITRISRHRYQPIVASRNSIFRLIRLNHADQFGGNKTSRKRWLVH